MKLLAISYVLPPQLFPQAIQVGRLLNGLDAEIVAVCGQISHQAAGLDCYPDFERRLISRVEVPFAPRLRGLAFKVAYHVLPLYGKVPDEFRRWVRPATRASLQFLSRTEFEADAIVSFGQPMSDHLVALALKDAVDLPWVAHFSDPWVENPFRRQGPLSRGVNRRLEAQVVERADRLVFTSQETLDQVMEKYDGSWRDKAHVLPHGYEPQLYGEEKQAAERPLRLRHLGSFYGRRSPVPLFNALSLLLKQSPQAMRNVTVELIGSIPPRFLRSLAYRRLPAGLVRIVPSVQYTQSLRMMREADLLMVIDAPADLSVFLPSKLVDYIGAGRPLIGIVPPGASARLIGRVGGEIADPRDVHGIASMLQRALQGCRQRRADGVDSPWGEQSVREEYLADRVTSRFNDIIAQAVRGGR